MTNVNYYCIISMFDNMNLDNMIIIIAQIFGIISWLLLMYSYTKEDIDNLLFIQILVCLFDVISYLLLGAEAGLLICLVELIKTVLYYKTDKDRLIFQLGLIFYILISFLTVKTWYSILPVLGSVIDSFGVSKDSKMANIYLKNIIEFKVNRKNYLIIESINIKKEYEKVESIKLIDKKIKSFINIKHRQRVFINKIIFLATSESEYMNFIKVKELDDNTYLYELSSEIIKEKYIK